MMRKQKQKQKQKQKEKENVDYKSGQGHQSLYDKQRSSLIYMNMKEMILGENNGA
jgi:hypothetical protein